MGKSKEIIVGILVIIILSFIFGSGMGNILVGNLNLLDEGQFAAWPFQMISGKLMYRDLFVMYGPLYVYPLFVAFKLFGASFFAIRVIFWIEALIGIITVFLLARRFRLKNVTTGLIVSFLIILPTMQIRQAAALLTCYFLYFANERKNPLWAAVAGALTSITFLISPEIGIFLAFSAALFILADLVAFVRSGKLMSFFFANVVVMSLFEMWAFSQGWLGAYVSETQFVLQSFSGSSAALGKNFPNLLAMIPRDLTILNILKLIFSPEAMLYWSVLFLIIGFIYFATRIIMRQFTTKDRYVLPMYTLALFSFLTVVGRASVNNIYFVLPFALIVGGYLVEVIISEFKPWTKNMNQKLIPALVIFVIIMIPARLVIINRVNIVNNLKMLTNYSLYKPISESDPLRISPSQKEYFTEVKRIVSERTKKGDSIFVLHDEPGLYVVADRVNATKYDLPYFANQRKLRLKIVEDLKVKKPKVIIWNPKAWAVDEISNDSRLPEVVRFLNSHYNRHLIGDVFVYELKNGKR